MKPDSITELALKTEPANLYAHAGLEEWGGRGDGNKV